MTVTNLELGFNRKSTTYGPLSYGNHAGKPVVDFAVSKSDSNMMAIRSIDSLLETYNWKRKLNSGFARLQFHGKNVFDEEHTEGIGELSRLLDARFVDFELTKQELNTEVPREISNAADYYRIFVPDDREFDEDVFEFFTEQANSFGNVDFIFKVDSPQDESYIRDIVMEYGIYDSDVWLYPKGRKAQNAAERMEYVIDISKSNTWNVSPRIGAFASLGEESD